MATKKKRKSPTFAERIKIAKSPSLEKFLPGGGATKVVKGLKSLTKAEKSLRTKLKQSIRERIEDKEIRTGLQPRNAKMVRQKKKAEAFSRKALRSDIRNLGKIVGDKEAAKFTQAKRAMVRGSSAKPIKAKPRARIGKNK